MSKLRESTIQEKAIDYLHNHYKDLYNAKQVYSRKEVKTTKKYGKKRADGLLCFHSTFQREHTVSVEAKSHKTIGSLIPLWEDEKFGFHSLVFGLLISLSILIIIHDWEWYWLLLTFLLVFPLSSFLVLIIFAVFELDAHKSLSVVRQAHQYPANEKWVAISSSSFNLVAQKKTKFRRRDSQENFQRICRKNKIGVLLISRNKIDVLQHPEYVPGYYLESYCIHSKVQSFLRDKQQFV